ncbi:MAG: amino acid decarboxylase [Enterococcus sp.]
MDHSFSTTAEGYQMDARVSVIGKDLLITLTGGDTPHIGTVTTFTKKDPVQTIRYPSHHGRFHKDDVLAEALAKEIKEKVPGNCLITSGVHIDGITQAQIKVSYKMAQTIGLQIAQWLDKTTFDAKEPVYTHYHKK